MGQVGVGAGGLVGGRAGGRGSETENKGGCEQEVSEENKAARALTLLLLVHHCVLLQIPPVHQRAQLPPRVRPLCPPRRRV